MNLGVREEMEASRRSVDEEAKSLKNSQLALERSAGCISSSTQKSVQWPIMYGRNGSCPTTRANASILHSAPWACETALGKTLN